MTFYLLIDVVNAGTDFRTLLWGYSLLQYAFISATTLCGFRVWSQSSTALTCARPWIQSLAPQEQKL